MATQDPDVDKYLLTGTDGPPEWEPGDPQECELCSGDFITWDEWDNVCGDCVGNRITILGVDFVKTLTWTQYRKLSANVHSILNNGGGIEKGTDFEVNPKKTTRYPVTSLGTVVVKDKVKHTYVQMKKTNKREAEK